MHRPSVALVARHGGNWIADDIAGSQADLERNAVGGEDLLALDRDERRTAVEDADLRERGDGDVGSGIDEPAEAAASVAQAALVVVNGDDPDESPHEEEREDDDDQGDQRANECFHGLRPLFGPGLPVDQMLIAADRSPAAEARSLHGRRSACVEADPTATSVKQESNLQSPGGRSMTEPLAAMPSGCCVRSPACSIVGHRHARDHPYPLSASTPWARHPCVFDPTCADV